MGTELLEIQPQELRFIFELKKQCSCSVRLVNKTNQHVAFKVKTTSPKKYCVRPNTGVLNPKAICDFTVTMQAQWVIPPDMICKDKFLLQCVMVAAGTTEKDITSAMFAKDGKYVEEKKLRVILVGPPNSPVLSPVNERLKQVQSYDVLIPEDQNPNSIENFSPSQTVIEDVKETKLDATEDSKPVIKENTEELMLSKDVVHEKKDDIISIMVKDMEELKVVKDIEDHNDIEFKIITARDVLKLVKEIEEVKSKIREFESKLIEAERTISKLTEEKRLNTQDRKNLQQESHVEKKKLRVQSYDVSIPEDQNPNSIENFSLPQTFAKDVQHVEEKKLRVQSYDVSIPEDQNPNSIENFSLPQTVRRILGSFAARISCHKHGGSRPYDRLLPEHPSINQSLLEKTTIS